MPNTKRVRTKSTEDYLRAIYKIHEESPDHSPGIRSIDVSKRLKVSKPSVSQMIKKLCQRGLTKMDLYSTIRLTPRGLRLAKVITHNYRVIEVFLEQTLQYRSPTKICQEAHCLEHAFSAESIKRLDKLLNNPTRCPHGDIIHK